MPALIPILIGTVVAGTTISVVGQVKAGNAAKRAGEAQRALGELEAEGSDFNASVADQQAQDAIARGHLESSRYRSQVRQLIGSQRAAYAGQNVDVRSGSAVDVQADTAQLGDEDAQTLEANAAREAYGFTVDAENLRTQAAAQRAGGAIAYQTGVNAQTASRWNAGATAFGGAAQVGTIAGFNWPRTAPPSPSAPVYRPAQ